MGSFDWSQFTQRIAIKTDAQKIYDLWSTPAGLEYWFLKNALFKKKDGVVRNRSEHIEAGDSYEWNWFGWSDNVWERGEILDANGKDFFRFVFGKAGIVSISIAQESDYVMVELKQEQIPTDEESKKNFHIGCSTGWAFYLVNMKSILEGGLDLRNKDTRLTGMINS